MFSSPFVASAAPYLGPPRMTFSPYTPSYDANGRQNRFYESPEQRSVRLAFVNARRVASWVDTHKTSNAKAATPNSVPSAYLQPLTETEEIEEPYILYSSSDSLSSSSSSSSSSSPQSSPVLLEEMMPSRRSAKHHHHHHRRSSSSSTSSISRRPSLDSIIEVSEE